VLVLVFGRAVGAVVSNEREKEADSEDEPENAGVSVLHASDRR
jgi:hypothetical protein